MQSRSLHHRRSIRLPTYDYRERGAYFVTICTQNRAMLFEDARFATIAEGAWLRFVNREARLEHGDFVLMPNHVHGIIWLPRPTAIGAQRRVMSLDQPWEAEANLRFEQPLRPSAAPLQRPDPTPRCLLPESLGAIVRAYKSFTANRINRVRNTPGAPFWQRNYYERVIRDDRELQAIRGYILDNPRKWAEDANNSANWA